MTEFRAVPASEDRFLWLSGELDLPAADDFARALDPAVRSGGAIVLDLTGVTFIDSDGIRLLLGVASGVEGRGCVILHNATPHVAKILQIVGIGSVPNVHLLDGPHADVALRPGPGAWSLVDAFHHLSLDVAERVARADVLALRNRQLRQRVQTLVSELARTRRVAAAGP